jgi:hypothetical protein
MAGLLATVVMDPEKALWVPGKKVISIPKPEPVGYSRIFWEDRMIGVSQYAPGQIVWEALGKGMVRVDLTGQRIPPPTHLFHMGPETKLFSTAEINEWKEALPNFTFVGALA